MHFFESANGTSFNYSSDLSGGVEVRTPGGKTMVVNGQDLAEFVAHWVVQQRLWEIENTAWRQVLGVPRETVEERLDALERKVEEREGYEREQAEKA